MNAPLLYLSRARLRHDAPGDAVSEAVSRLGGTRAATAHRLIWALFGDNPDRPRDFLWREAEPGVFYLLSARVPEDRSGLFRLDEAKLFAPSLAPGDRLQFVLRANATIARKPEGAGSGARGKRCDVVMDAIHALPRGSRAGPRGEVLADVATRWLVGQGEKSGFEVAERDPDPDRKAGEIDQERREALRVTGYRVLRIGRSRGRAAVQLGILDLEGTLVVREPVRFVAALAHGFGRGKAFGCGLMLVRRVR
jgi:CRISPR system Cascade subunit CasE